MVRYREAAICLLRSGCYWSLVAVTVLVAAEAATRLDDWIRLGISPLQHTYSKDDLVLRGPEGTRGRPYARYRKWRLNGFGFRGPEIDLVPSPRRARIAVLGASEAFGLYESEGREFPAQLAEALNQGGADYEVVNAAIAGMTIGSMVPYWEEWVSRFRPQIVILYASPLFYLSDSFEAQSQPTPGAMRPVGTPARRGRATASGPKSRFLVRLKDAIELPEFIQKRRRERWIAASVDGKPPGWFFRTAPPDRLDLFMDDLEKLSESIRARGAEPVLLTHALRASTPPRPEDLDDLNSLRAHLPRATAGTFVAFNEAANESIKAFGVDRDIPVLDVAGVMNGRRDLFADLVHFNDRGASVIAGLIAERIEAACPPPQTTGRVVDVAEMTRSR